LLLLFTTGVNDTDGKFAAGVVGTGGNLPPAKLTMVANLPPVSLTPVTSRDRMSILSTPLPSKWSVNAFRSLKIVALENYDCLLRHTFTDS
jgi:hypothetical protein